MLWDFKGNCLTVWRNSVDEILCGDGGEGRGVGVISSYRAEYLQIGFPDDVAGSKEADGAGLVSVAKPGVFQVIVFFA